MADAQDAYRALIRDHLAPALRALGFTGSGSAFRLPIPDAIALLGFQRSIHNDRQRVTFTVNLTAGPMRTWREARLKHPWLPERPSANSRYPGGLWTERLGLQMPGGQDRWWEVTDDTDLPRLGAEVTAAIRDHGLPALRRHAAEGS